MELSESFKNLNKISIIGDICDKNRVSEIFSKFRPDIIFHAAAYKHVPLMEVNPVEAIRNNILGTKVIAENAIYFDVEKFIMLSTDKAVDPINIMGVTKRVAELYIDFALIAINFNSLFVFNQLCRSGDIGDCGDAVFPCDDGSMR